MKSNNIFTYLLYALLGGLIIVAGYLALEQRKKAVLRNEELKRDQAAYDQTVGTNQQIDTSSNGGSTFAGEKPSTPTSTADKNGIEKDDPAAKPGATAPAKPITGTAVKTPAPVTNATKTAPVQPVAAPKQLVSKGLSTPKKTIAPAAPSGRYAVKVGVFSQIANARSEMERYVQMGYREAEVSKYKNDTWCVIIKRTNSKTAAEQFKNDLAHRGLDAQILDSKK